MKYLQSILVVVTLISFAFGGYFYVDKTYAKDYTVQQIEQRLDIKILKDASRDLRSDINYIRKLFYSKEMPFDIKVKMDRLIDEKKAIDNELNLRIQELIRKK